MRVPGIIMGCGVHLRQCLQTCRDSYPVFKASIASIIVASIDAIKSCFPDSLIGKSRSGTRLTSPICRYSAPAFLNSTIRSLPVVNIDWSQVQHAYFIRIPNYCLTSSQISLLSVSSLFSCIIFWRTISVIF